MKTITATELKNILVNHKLWIEGKGGKCSGDAFEGADLRSADFRDANLKFASFLGADLRDADFRNADLVDTWFVDADLRNANFQNSNLTIARLMGANIQGANFGDAILNGTVFEKPPSI